MSYLAANKTYWEKGYVAAWPDHCVFRFWGRIVAPDFSHLIGGKLIEFGCGQGAAVNFFHMNGMDAAGTDISETDISAAKIRYPHLAKRFSVCAADPREVEHYGHSHDVSMVTAIQALYYFNDADFDVCIRKLYDCMKPGALFYATMMGEQASEFFDNSQDAGSGLRRVTFKNDRLDVKNYFMSFIKDEDHLKRKFSLFRPLHIGHYCCQLRNDEGDAFHYTFCGMKD